ncbi:hypothetical protein KKG38_03795 [Patescibacteria group bacterium]|nr:hypothetical protein [Patescibacteria group bacterium]
MANSLNCAIDLIGARIAISNPERVVFSVGTQINGIPHIGTYLVQTTSFVLAGMIQEKFDIPCEVCFGALDNAPYDITQGKDGTEFQRAYGHVLSSLELHDLLSVHYLDFFDELAKIVGISYSWSTYKDQQSMPSFRYQFIKSLQFQEVIRWCVAPSNGILRVRLPNSDDDFYAQKRGEHTKIIYTGKDKVLFRCRARDGRFYEKMVSVDGDDGTYLDLNTLYRNVIKEAVYSQENGTLGVMVKGGDWTMSTQPVDWALGALGYTSVNTPMRFFTPQVITGTGAKLSKSLIRDNDGSMFDVPNWLLDMSKFREEHPDYVSKMIWLVQQFLSHPRHMFRCYTYTEIMRLLEAYRKEE